MGNLEKWLKRQGVKFRKKRLTSEDIEGLTVVGKNRPLKSDPQRASHLQNIYTAIKAVYEGNQFRRKSRNKGIINIFNSIAVSLEYYEDKTAQEIDDTLFVLAQFKKYGKNTYPGHLLGGRAIDIYHEIERGLSFPAAPLPPNYDQKLLENLCEVREENEKQVMEKLQDAGIFSTAFVRKWKAKRMRRI